MTDNAMADVPQEGANPFGEGTGDATSADSPAEENKTDDTQPDEGENSHSDDGTDDADDASTTADDNKPFHEHPRWKQREEEWETRFNTQESRHQDDIKSIREDFAKAREDNADQSEIPDWFGGTEKQWSAYQKDQDAKIKEAEERTINRMTEAKTAESKAVEDATTYMRTEIASIESDTKLNPDGAKIDPNKLLKTVIDNDLVDSQGRWNYKAGWRMISKGTGKKSADDVNDRKKVAAATTSESKGEGKTKAYKTSKDFEQNRPW